MCLGIGYSLISLPGNPYTKEAIGVYYNIMTNYNKLRLESWTKSILAEINLNYIWEPLPGEKWSEEIDDSGRLISYFQRGVILEYMKIKKYTKAREEFNKLKRDKRTTKENLSLIKEMIISWEQKW